MRSLLSMRRPSREHRTAGEITDKTSQGGQSNGLRFTRRAAGEMPALTGQRGKSQTRQVRVDKVMVYGSREGQRGKSQTRTRCDQTTVYYLRLRSRKHTVEGQTDRSDTDR